MKKLFWAICATILISGCGLTKKITKSKESKETTEKTTESTSESTNTVKETAPTESQVVFDISDFEQMMDGFTQRIASGNGSESTIEKRDGKLFVTNKTAGSRDAESTSKETQKETIYNSEFVVEETKKVIKRLPWWIWTALIIWLLILFRKVIAEMLVLFVPGLAGARLINILLGNKPE